jgi:ATP-dependent Clp protease ATP-binding subunit ClpC
MFERYTDHARRIIFHARHTASQSGSSTIETEHLLLGLLNEAGPLIPRLTSLATEDIYRKIPRKTVAGAKTAAPLIMPLSPECRRILNYSAEEANSLNHRCIGAVHLLLAILREDKCKAAHVLEEAGIQLEPLRERVVADMAQREGPDSGEWIPVDVCRETVHALVDELPEKMLGYAKIAIDHMLSNSRVGSVQDFERRSIGRRLSPVGQETSKARVHHAGEESKFL